MKALLIGSGFMEELCDYLDYFESKILIVNESPLSDKFSLVLDNIKEDVDCVLLDLMVCANWLFKQSGEIKTLHTDDKAKYVFNPATFKCTQFDKSYNAFINTLLNRFTSDQLFVISASLPPYFVIQSQLRDINKANYLTEWKRSYKFIKKLEEKLIKKTNAKVINLSQYYFLKKPTGYDVSFVRYEEYLYKDINQWLYDFKNGLFRETAIFQYKLDRYILYQYKTIHYKGFNRFLNAENIVDKLILSSSRDYVKENYKNFTRLSVLAEQSCKNDLYDLVQKDVGLTEDFRQVVLAFLILQKNTIWENAPENFGEMFRKGVVSDDIKKEIRNQCCNYGINPHKITKHNAGYYYMEMKHRTEEARQYVAENTVISPTLVDVYGSCIAYQPINEFISGATEVVHNNYYMHVPTYESSEMPVKHPEVVWQGEPSDEFEKNVRIQFEHLIEEDIKKSDADWCLVDLFSLVAPRTYLYKDFCFTDYGNKTWQKFGAKNIHPWNGYYQELLQTEDFIEKIHTWTKWLKAKYGDNIILINFKVSKYKIGDDDCIYYPYENADRKNEIIDKVYGLVKNWLNCYCIEFGREFLADDVGYSSSGSVHYELDFYEAEAAVIQNIIATKPEQKIYKTYSDEVRVNRIIRLARNNSPGMLCKIFKGNLDKIIISLPAEIMERYKKEIVNFYKTNIDNRIDLLKEISLLEAKDPLYYYELKKHVFEAEAYNEADDSEVKTNYDKMPEMAIYDKYKNKQMVNTTYTVEFYDGDSFLFKQTVIYGVKTKLLSIPPSEKVFLGWKAYRMSDGKVTCVQKDGKRAFIEEELLDENNVLYLFPDGANVAKNSKIDGDVIKMYAVWQ